MPYFILEDFRLGQDSRKSNLTAAPGTLTTLVNAHITRGGDLEKRKAFVSKYSLPANTFGLIAAAGTLYTFGSASAPTMPAGVSYQQLAHPTGQAMTALVDADVFNGKIYAAASYADGSTYHFYDGTRVTTFTDAKARASFDITGGTNSAGVNKVSSIKVNGIEVLNTAVDWVTSNSATAAAVAAQINTYNSAPEYTATSSGATVIIISSTAGTGPNGYTVTISVGGNVTVSPASTTLSGGVDTTATFTPGTAVRTFGTKEYTISGSNLVFSAVNQPTDFNDDVGVGSGSINMQNHSSGSDTLTALEIFYDKMAIFAAQTVQLWALSANPDNNAQAQVIQNTGTSSPKSVFPFGDGDVFYLASNGVRALKAFSVNVVAQVSEVGTPIDTDVIDYMSTLSASDIANAVATLEPIDKRYWLAIGSRVYVYSYFAGSKIAAWSTYEPGFAISDFAILSNRVYARSGDTIYLYGGATNDTYDACAVTVTVPYLDAQTPANFKTLRAIDIVAEGLWSVQMASNPQEPDSFDDLGIFNGTTLHQDTMPAYGFSPYFCFKLTHQKEEYARFSRFIMHFEKDDSKAA